MGNSVRYTGWWKQTYLSQSLSFGNETWYGHCPYVKEDTSASWWRNTFWNVSEKAKHNLMRSSYGVQTTEKMGDSRQAKQLWCYYLLIRQQTEPQLIFLKDICVEKNWSDRRPLFAIRQKLILRQDNCLQNVVREKYWGSVSSSITLVSKNI